MTLENLTSEEAEELMLLIFGDVDDEQNTAAAIGKHDGEETAVGTVQDFVLSPSRTNDPTNDNGKKRPADVPALNMATASPGAPDDSTFFGETAVTAAPTLKKTKTDNLSVEDFFLGLYALPMLTPSPAPDSLDPSFFIEPAVPAAAKKKAETETGPVPKFSKMIVPKLRVECIKRGLTASGKKSDLLKRLKNPQVAAKDRKKGDYTVAQVHTALESMGCTKLEDLSDCAKSAIQKGHVRLIDGLDQVVATWTCCQCHEQVNATLRACLDQPDYAGLDYKDGNQKGAIQCKDCGIGQYVSNMCSGSFEITSGKFHNHCSECPGLGCCMGDYRELHCALCDGHYFTGLGGFPCPCAERSGEMTGLMCGMASAGYTIGPWLGGDEGVFDEEGFPSFESP